MHKGINLFFLLDLRICIGFYASCLLPQIARNLPYFPKIARNGQNNEIKKQKWTFEVSQKTGDPVLFSL